MRLEFMNRVRANDVLGKSIFTPQGQILLKAGIKLNDIYINKLRELGVSCIYVEDERFEDVDVEDEKLTQLKQLTMKNMNGMINNLYNCDRNKFEKSLDVVKELINYIINMGDVNKSLLDIQTYDNYTFLHCIDTCIMASFLGITSGFCVNELEELGIGAMLHDIGKTQVPIKVLNKKTKLTDEEFAEIKKHPLYGAEILKKVFSIPDSVIKVVEQHHERVDGNGYPYGLTSKQITKFSKLVCICDVYDAVSNDRCYREKFGLNDAYELILSGSDTSFDRECVLNFKNTFAIYPLGCHVKLSNNEDGYIIRQNRGFPDRPVLRVFNEKDYNKGQFHEIDLLDNTKIVISGTIE